jgi:ABC-2 type transport system ATP-binding protein
LAKLYGVPQRQRLDRIHTALNYVGLDSVAHRLVNTYSGGMIRRLEMAQATLHRPPVLFLDEPTVGLDPVASQSHVGLDFAAAARLPDHGVSHHPLYGRGGCAVRWPSGPVFDHRIAMLYQGQQVAIGTPRCAQTVPHSDAALGATMDDVFIHYTRNPLTTETEGSYRDPSTTRRPARRLG